MLVLRGGRFLVIKRLEVPLCGVQSVASHTAHSGLRGDFRPEMGRKSVALSVGSALCSYGIAYRRAYG